MEETADIEAFRILTFNVWGLKYLSERRNERIAALTSLLVTSPHHVYDVICLQELWVEADFLSLKSTLRYKYPHSAYWPGSIVGSGLAIFSKWQITGRDFLAFGVCGEPGEIGGDWYAGKGVGSAVMKVGKLGEVEIFNTHFFAKGGEEGPETRRAVRISHAWEMAKLVRKAIASGRHVIAAGDFNSSPHSLPMKTMFSHANLVDTWTATHPPPPTSPPGTYSSSGQQSAQEALGMTVDTPQNSWSAGKKLDNFARRWLGKRLDYILYNSSPITHSRSTGSMLSVRNTAIVLTERVPGYDFSYSDHFGLEATFAVIPFNGLPPSDSQTVNPGPSMLPPEDLLTAIGALSHAMHISDSRTRRHIFYLIISLFFLLLAILGPAWVDPASTRWRWNAFFAAVVGAISTFGGMMAVCAGILYGIRERSRLTNFIEEMECERRR